MNNELEKWLLICVICIICVTLYYVQIYVIGLLLNTHSQIQSRVD